MKTDEEEPDKMIVNYAASKSLIKNPSQQQSGKAFELLQRIIETTLRGMKMAGGDEEKTTV